MWYADSDIHIVLQWWAALFLWSCGFSLTKFFFPFHTGTSKQDTDNRGGLTEGIFSSSRNGMCHLLFLVWHNLGCYLYVLIASLLRFLSFVVGIILRIFQGRSVRIDHSIFQFHTASWHSQKGEEAFFYMYAKKSFFLEPFYFGLLLKRMNQSEGLEKFWILDLCVTTKQSVFPAPDMWWSGGFINYYFFDTSWLHSWQRCPALDLFVTFNLMLHAVCVNSNHEFSIGVELVKMGYFLGVQKKKSKKVWTYYLHALQGSS